MSMRSHKTVLIHMMIHCTLIEEHCSSALVNKYCVSVVSFSNNTLLFLSLHFTLKNEILPGGISQYNKSPSMEIFCTGSLKRER